MTAPNTKTVTITAGSGFVALILLYCLGQYLTGLALQQTPRWLPTDLRGYQDIDADTAPVGGFNFDTSIQGLQAPRVPVNTAARDEIKGQCPPQLQPGERIVPGSVRIVHQPQIPYQPPSASPGSLPPSGASPRTPVPAQPAAPAQPSKLKSTPTSKKNLHLAVFIDNSQWSREVFSWFDTDPSLRKLRESCHFQKYDTQNALYKARYAGSIPPERFPAVILMEHDGGHIYASSGSMLPTDPASLCSDIRAASQLLADVRKQSPAAQATGQATEDCDGPDCPVPLDGDEFLPSQPGRDPIFPLFDRDRDRQPSSNPLELLRISRTNWLDSAAVLIAVIFAGLILLHTFRK